MIHYQIKTSCGRHKSAGFSLVEVMVSLVISLFILGGAVTILIQNQQNYRHNDDFGRLQENARFALDLITSDLRMGGFMGCSVKVNNILAPAAGSLLNSDFAIDGYEQGSSAWAQGDSTLSGIWEGTDALTIRKVRNRGVPILAHIPGSGSPPSGVITAPNAEVRTGELAAIYDCFATNIFRATAVSGNQIDYTGALTFNNQPYTYQQNTAYTLNPGADPNGLSAKTYIAALDAVRYYIAASERDSGQPALFRQFDSGTGGIVEQELIEGVENMQILYGRDDSGTGEPGVYVNAATVGDWSRVVAVKITLLISTIEQYGSETDTKPYDIHDTPDNITDDWTAPADRRSRKLVSATVLLRNMQPKIAASI